MPDTLGVAIIGTGFGVNAHAPAIKDTAGLELRAICSARIERAKAAAEKLGVGVAVDDYNAVIGMDGIDIVVVTAPPHLHHPMVMAAIAAGKQVVCEKPMALKAPESREMIAAAERAGTVNAIAFEFRYLPERLRVRQMIGEGYVGDIQTFNLRSFSGYGKNAQRRPWMVHEEYGGGQLGGFGSHCFDMIRSYIGDFAGVFGQRDHHIKTAVNSETGAEMPMETEDGFRALFTMRSGATGAFNFDLTVPLPEVAQPNLSCEIYGSEGTIIVSSDGDVRAGKAGGAIEPLDLPPRPGMGPYIGTAMRMFYADFLAVCHGEARPDMPRFVDGLRCQEFMDALIESDRSRRWVDIPA